MGLLSFLERKHPLLYPLKVEWLQQDISTPSLLLLHIWMDQMVLVVS